MMLSGGHRYRWSSVTENGAKEKREKSTKLLLKDAIQVKRMFGQSGRTCDGNDGVGACLLLNYFRKRFL